MSSTGSLHKGGSGKWRTNSLFYEFTYRVDANAPFTWADEDRVEAGQTFRSLKKIYLELDDPTGYRIATEVLGGWQHWLALKKNATINAWITEWEKELEVKVKSEALRTLVSDANDGDSNSATASAKFLLDKGWADKRRAGAPSTAETKAALTRSVVDAADVDDDLKRITIN